VEAANSAIAAGRLREMGVTVEKVRPVTAARQSVSLATRFAENFIYPVISGVRLTDLAVMYRQWATLIHAGIPLYQSLVSLEKQVRNAKLRAVIVDLQKQALAGGPLSEVMAEYRWIFSPMQVEMIRAAEYGGLLDQMLTRIADYLDQEIEVRRMISKLTLMPKITTLVALLILGKSCFLDWANPFVPAVARLVLGQMGKDPYTGVDYLTDTVGFLLLLGGMLFAVTAFCRLVLFQSDSAREAYEQLKFSLPGLGPTARQFALAKFGRAFSALYAAGLPIGTAVSVAGTASGSRIVARATARAVEAAERGATLSSAFRETGAFPPIVLDMLHTGEQTGNVDAMMQKVAEYLEGEASSRAHLASNLFAVGVSLAVAILIGAAVIRFYMGFFSGLSQIE
jgi:type II secretory pathway component PulF